MKGEPALEAVKVDRKRRFISVATLGHPKTPNLEGQLRDQIRGLQESAERPRCALLAGEKGCTTCPLPEPRRDDRQITIQHEGDVTTIARITCPTAPKFWRWHEIPWPKMVPRRIMLPDEAEHEQEWKLQLTAAILCGVFGLAGYFSGGPAILSFYLAAYLAGGWYAAHEVWERLRKRVLDVHFLMLVVAVGSASIGAWGEGAVLLFLFSFSGALEHFAMGRTQREIRSLFKTAPKVATVLEEHGGESIVPVDLLQPGMRLLCRPGEQFPVDAEVVKGETASDESNLTGEAAPVEKRVGDAVFAGALNLWGAVEAVVLRPASQSALQRIIQLIQEAQKLKAPSQRFTDRFGTPYTYGVLAASTVMFFVWWLGFGLEPFVSAGASKSAFYRTMTLLVVSSPCALVLSVPSAILAAIAWAARRGILFRGGAAVEKLAEVSIVAMDKTGTLTTGELRVETVESFPPGRERDLAAMAFSMERYSTHPLARAITRFGKQQQLQPLEVTGIESVTGQGLRARHINEHILLGKRAWVLARAAGEGEARARSDSQSSAGSSSPIHLPPAGAGFAEVWVRNGGLLGRVLLRDDIRPKAREVVVELRNFGLKSVVLTGDHQAAGEYLKEKLLVDDVRAELNPEEKVRVIQTLAERGQKVAMIGDGVNDAPSLAAAYVGVAMGARGADAALEQAEVVLMHDRLENFLAAFELSRSARRIIRQNVVISLGTVAMLVVLALLGAIPLTIGVIGHEGSTVVVVLNSLRLLFLKPAAIAAADSPKRAEPLKIIAETA